MRPDEPHIKGEDLPKRQSIMGDTREYGKKEYRKFYGRVSRKGIRNKVRNIRG